MKSNEMWCYRVSWVSRQCVAKSVVVVCSKLSDAAVGSDASKVYKKQHLLSQASAVKKSKNKSNSIYFTYLPTLVDLPNPPIPIEDTLHQISFFRL